MFFCFLYLSFKIYFGILQYIFLNQCLIGSWKKVYHETNKKGEM